MRLSIPRIAPSAGRALPAIAATLLLAGCGAQSTAPAPSGPAGAAGPSDAPARPAVNRVVLAVAPPGFESNEMRHIGQSDTWQLRPVYEKLLGYDAATGATYPQLATEWKLLPGGLSFEFTLRKGVQFHNGYGEMTAKDVNFSVRELVKEDSTGSPAPNWRQMIKSVDDSDLYKVVLNLREANANFMNSVSELEGGGEIQSAANFDKTGPATMQTGALAGTGPYQYLERSQSSFIRFSRVPYQQWRATADFPEFEFRFMREASTRMAALLASEVQLASLPNDLTVQAERQGYTIIRGKVAGLRTFLSMYCCMFNDPNDFSKGRVDPSSPLLDLRVRRALDKAINRDEMNKGIFGGKGEVMILNHFHPSRPGWNPDWEKRWPGEYGYAPAKAKAILAEAGYDAAHPLSTSMFVEKLAQYSGSDDVAETVANYWRAAGVKVDLLQMDAAQITNATRSNKLTNHFRVTATSAALLLGVATYTSTYPQGRGVAGALDPVAEDILLNQIYKQMDVEKHPPLYRQLGDRMFEQHMSIPLFWLPAEIVVNPKVVGGYVFPGSISGTWTHVQNIKAAR